MVAICHAIPSLLSKIDSRLLKFLLFIFVSIFALQAKHTVSPLPSPPPQVEMALDSLCGSSEQTDLGPPGSGKLCGHPCVMEEQELCCLCTKELQEEILRVT